MVDLFALFVPATHLPVRLEAPINGRTLAATLGVTLLAGLAFGLVPAWRASRPSLNDALKAGGRSSGSAEHHHARHALVVTEIALALVLLVGAGLCLRGLQRARQLDAGLDANGVLLAGLRVGMNGYTRETAPAFYRTLRQRLKEAPGVQSVALANWFPLGFEDTGTNGVEIPGRPRQTGDELNFRLAIVSPDYFATLGIPLLAGRDFTDRDDDTAQRVAIINEAMAQRFWPGQDVLGRTFKNNGRDTTIIGVAKTGKYRGLSDPPECFFYLPCTQATWALDLGVAVRASGSAPANLGPVLRRELQSIDPAVQIWQSLPLAAYIEAASVPQQIASSLLSLLGVVALALAGMGVYAVMSYAVGQRTQEFGVRLALGARPADLVADVVRRGLRLAVVGSIIGLACALVVTRLLSGFLFGVSPFDPATFTLVPLLLGLTAILACYLPALRATRVNPLTALRAE